MDATHPQHTPIAVFGWIKRGTERKIRSNTGCQRLNINGAIRLSDYQPEVRFDGTVNATSTVELCRQIEAANPKAKRIHIICDNARYYRSRIVSEYLKDAKIILLFLPPYASNLNLIERYWKFFKKKVLYNRYFDSFKKFQDACEVFFKDSTSHAPELRSLLNEKFQIIHA